jgi:hypothetical protein
MFLKKSQIILLKRHLKLGKRMPFQAPVIENKISLFPKNRHEGAQENDSY